MLSRWPGNPGSGGSRSTRDRASCAFPGRHSPLPGWLAGFKSIYLFDTERGRESTSRRGGGRAGGRGRCGHPAEQGARLGSRSQDPGITPELRATLHRQSPGAPHPAFPRPHPHPGSWHCSGRHPVPTTHRHQEGLCLRQGLQHADLGPGLPSFSGFSPQGTWLRG